MPDDLAISTSPPAILHRTRSPEKPQNGPYDRTVSATGSCFGNLTLAGETVVLMHPAQLWACAIGVSALRSASTTSCSNAAPCYSEGSSETWLATLQAQASFVLMVCANHGLRVCAPKLLCGTVGWLVAQYSTIFDNTRNIEACQKVSWQADIIVFENIAEQAHKAFIDGADSNVFGFDSFVEHAHRQG